MNIDEKFTEQSNVIKSKVANLKSSAPGRLMRFFIIVSLLVVVNGSWYKVDQTERANIRRFGVAIYTKPVQPGLHFKIPFIDTVDRIQISLKTLHIPPFDVTTIDNQKITLDENFNYTISDDKVYHVMYEIGRAGNSDIDSQVVPVVKDRTGRIFSGQNMTTVNANRQSIQAEIEKAVSKSVEELFGIQPHSLQIAGITPSPAFMASNEEAVKAKKIGRAHV